jgi:hypothetical protein
MMEAARTSETLVNFYQTTGATTQNTAIFVLTAVRTSNPTHGTSTVCVTREQSQWMLIFFDSAHCDIYSKLALQQQISVDHSLLGCDAVKMETIRSSETLVNTYKTTLRHNPEEKYRHLYSRENFKTQTDFYLQ